MATPVTSAYPSVLGVEERNVVTLWLYCPIPVHVCVGESVCVCEEEAEKGMSTGWSLLVNGSDSKTEKEKERE